MRIKNIVENLCRKHKTRDPVELARSLGIYVFFEPLGNIQGYYNKSRNQKMIHVNCCLSEESKKITCAHELGHAVLQPDSNTPFLKNNTFMVVNKMEIEANRFMVDLLHTDEDMLEYIHYTIPEIACCLNLDESIVKYRMEVIDPIQLTFDTIEKTAPLYYE